jgi:hypothetical protein
MLIATLNVLRGADLLLDLQAALLGVGVLHVRIHGGEVDQHAGGRPVLGRMPGNTGAPVCVGERLTLSLAGAGDVGGVARWTAARSPGRAAATRS